MKRCKWYIFVFCILIAGTGYCRTLPEVDTVVQPTKTAKAEYVGMDTCAMCHEKITKKFKRSEHSRIVVRGKDKEGQACEACHGPGGLHADAQTTKEKYATIINPGKHPEVCYKCHLDKKGEFSLQYHHPVPEGRMGCIDCHDPHGDDAIKPNTIASLSGKNSLCAKCHKEQTQPFVYEHEALREGCTVCHAVHGSLNAKMLVERDANLCMKCHFQANFTSRGFMGTVNHTTDINQGPCFSGGCHTQVHGSNYNPHLRN